MMRQTVYAGEGWEALPLHRNAAADFRTEQMFWKRRIHNVKNCNELLEIIRFESEVNL